MCLDSDYTFLHIYQSVGISVEVCAQQHYAVDIANCLFRTHTKLDVAKHILYLSE